MPYKKYWTNADSTIISYGPGNQGSLDDLTIDSPAGNEERFLIKFPFTDIPSNATITAATMVLTQKGTGTAATPTVQRCLLNWTETGVTWTSYDGTNNWNTAGAKAAASDYDATVLATITVLTSTPNGTQHEVDLTSTVQDWVDGTNDNYGLLLFDAGPGEECEFHSKEASVKSRWPFITVEWTVPAIGYAVNGTSVSGGIRASWPKRPTGMKADGARNYSNWYPHTWRISEMEMSDWQTLYNLRGTTLTGITTTAQDTPNVAATYATARLLNVTGEQLGRRMTNVLATFEVDVTS